MNRMMKLWVMLILLTLGAGCTGILQEEPRGLLTPKYFETAQGLEGGVTAAYASLRYFYGTEAGNNLTVYGTDEFTNGNQVTNPPVNNYQNLVADQPDLLTPWNRAYPAINTCNGVIELGPYVSELSEELKTNLISEAKFIRAQWYFILVQTFGGVTLDLGSGPLKFNRTPSNQFSRATLEEVYEAIIQDLTDAVLGLPHTPRDPGRAWKASALHLLAKVYLTRAWSEASQPEDFERALAIAQDLIDNRAAYGVNLLDDFADVFAEGNERNAEVLFVVERNGDVNFNIVDTQSGNNDANLQQNRSNFFFRMFYTEFDGMVRDVENGRPWVRYKPTDWLLNEAFAQKNIDSRYEKSFQTVWIANDPDPDQYPVWTENDAFSGYCEAEKVGKPRFYPGDTAVWFVPADLELTADQIKSLGYAVLTPEYVSSQKGHFPSLCKFEARERPIPGTEGDPNIASTRPYIVYRFAETYLIAAEAAHMLGQNSLAANYLNAIRRRAAYPGQEAAMEISSAEVDLDFILDERSRELAGEQMRWFDLTRTQRLIGRVQQYNPDGGPNIQPYHTLRPIPQSYIDLAVDPTTTDHKYPQNPGY